MFQRPRGASLMVGQKLPKLLTRVRFPRPALPSICIDCELPRTRMISAKRSLRMDVEPDPPRGLAAGAVDLSGHRVSLIGQPEREEERVVAPGTAEVEATDCHANPRCMEPT